MTKKKSDNYYKWKKEYYQKRRENITANRTKWSEQDITLLFEFRGTDNELSKVLNRSVQAIQVKRSKVIKNESQPVEEAPTLGRIYGRYEPFRFTNAVDMGGEIAVAVDETNDIETEAMETEAMETEADANIEL